MIFHNFKKEQRLVQTVQQISKTNRYTISPNGNRIIMEDVYVPSSEKPLRILLSRFNNEYSIQYEVDNHKIAITIHPHFGERLFEYLIPSKTQKDEEILDNMLKLVDLSSDWKQDKAWTQANQPKEEQL